MRNIYETARAAHQLHWLDTSDEDCRARLRLRNVKAINPFAVTEEEFERVSRYFVAPSLEEGFDLVLHTQAST